MSIEEGRQARDEGIENAAYQRSEWLALARAAAIGIARRTGTVTVNDLRKAIPPPPKGTHHNVWGGVFRTRALKPIGHTQVTHLSGHARWVQVHALAETV
jgi:hypothetical protein